MVGLTLSLLISTGIIGLSIGKCKAYVVVDLAMAST